MQIRTRQKEKRWISVIVFHLRRKGIAKELLSRVVSEAKEYGCGTVQITASDMGVKLYTDFGFKHNGNFMHYKL